jgi:hypothetical protein
MQDVRLVLGAKAHVDQKGTVTPVRAAAPLDVMNVALQAFVSWSLQCMQLATSAQIDHRSHAVASHWCGGRHNAARPQQA